MVPTTLDVTVTSKDGSNTSATKGTASTAITVNDGPDDLVATLDHTTAQQGVTMHVTGVKDGGITVIGRTQLQMAGFE